MYQFSRAIYRELAGEIAPQPVRPEGPSNHHQVLAAAESVVYRLATDRHYFAQPSKRLFADIRVFFPMGSQAKVHQVVTHYVARCEEWLDNLPVTGFDPAGNKLVCRATTRKGTPCQRLPLPRNGYCPSHQHLAEVNEAA